MTYLLPYSDLSIRNHNETFIYTDFTEINDLKIVSFYLNYNLRTYQDINIKKYEISTQEERLLVFRYMNDKKELKFSVSQFNLVGDNILFITRVGTRKIYAGTRILEKLPKYLVPGYPGSGYPSWKHYTCSPFHVF